MLRLSTYVIIPNHPFMTNMLRKKGFKRATPPSKKGEALQNTTFFKTLESEIRITHPPLTHHAKPSFQVNFYLKEFHRLVK